MAYTVVVFEKRGWAHRQTASTWLKNRSDYGILVLHKIGRTNYDVNESLIKIFSD